MLRALIRDIIAIILCWKLLAWALTGNGLSPAMAALLAFGLLFFTVWFLLERVGLLPRLGG